MQRRTKGRMRRVQRDLWTYTQFRSGDVAQLVQHGLTVERVGFSEERGGCSVCCEAFVVARHAEGELIYEPRSQVARLDD